MREGAVTAGGKASGSAGVVGVADMVGVMRDVVIKWVEVSVAMMVDAGMTSAGGVWSACGVREGVSCCVV